MGRLEVERPAGCDDPVFRAYCAACEATDPVEEDEESAFDRDELGIDPEEDAELWRS